MSDKEYFIELGNRVIAVLTLEPIMGGFDPVRYHTTWGSKTAEGIGRVIVRLTNETKGEQNESTESSNTSNFVQTGNERGFPPDMDHQL